jgi:hypothetical protein
MHPDYTHITIILDRTGSMESIRDDTIGGFNAFLKKQKTEPGIATLTLVQFDSQDPYEVIHHFKPIADVPELTKETFVPRASTPLYDALGRGINDLEHSIAERIEAGRPSRIMVVVVTDGQENASREFTKAQVGTMITEKITKNDWQFVFLSADLGALENAKSIGIAEAATLLFDTSAQGNASAWNSLAESTSNYRAKRSAKATFQHSDRKHPDDPATKKP